MYQALAIALAFVVEPWIVQNEFAREQARRRGAAGSASHRSSPLSFA